MNYSYDDLEGMTLEQLTKIKEEKMNHLYDIKKDGYVIISNILSIQKQIDEEIGNPKKENFNKKENYEKYR